jgi:hypothetical protein
MQLRNRMLGILVAAAICSPLAAHAQSGTAGQLIVGSLPRSRMYSGTDSWSGTLLGATVTIPPGSRDRTFLVSLNVTVELGSVRSGSDPHLMGAIRIVDVTTGTVVASSPVSLNNGRTNGSMSVPFALQATYRAPASTNSRTLGVELYTRGGSSITFQPALGLYNQLVGPGSFTALLVQ